MTNKVKPIPEGYHTVTPYLIIKDAANAIEFYKKAFAAKEIFSMKDEHGKVQHAEIKIGDSHLMIADEFPKMNVFGPSEDRSPVSLHLYVEDVDKTFNAAVAAGAKVVRPVTDQFYGDRLGCLTDPFGHSWSVSTHIEDVSPDELKKRAQKEKCC